MIQFILNGVSQTITIDGGTPLLWVLRDHFKLTGTEYGCGKGLCGVCTVDVDGEDIRSCQMPILLLEGRSITTIEGLSAREGAQHINPDIKD